MRIPKKDFQRFKNACERMCKLLGLQEYSRAYQHKSFKDGTYAELGWGDGDHTALFCLATSVKNRALYHSPELCAVHESVHLLVDRLSSMVPDSDEKEKVEEDIARRVENAFRSLLTPGELKALGD